MHDCFSALASDKIKDAFELEDNATRCVRTTLVRSKATHGDAYSAGAAQNWHAPAPESRDNLYLQFKRFDGTNGREIWGLLSSKKEIILEIHNSGNL